MPTHFLSFSLQTLPYGQKVDGSTPLSGHAGFSDWANKGAVVQRSAARINKVCFISEASYDVFVGQNLPMSILSSWMSAKVL